MRRNTPTGLAPLLIVVLTATSGAFAREGIELKKPHIVPRATSKVTIDGVIDEQAWQDALTLELDYEVRPSENMEPPVRTVAFIACDESHVLVAFRAVFIKIGYAWLR